MRALSRAVDYSHWVNRPPGTLPVFDDIESGRARGLVNRLLTRFPDGTEMSDEDVCALLNCFGIAFAPLTHVATLEEAIAAGESFGWDVVLKATATPLRQRPDLAHVWRSVDDEIDMHTAWVHLTERIDEPDRADFVVQPMARSGIPVQIGALEDRLFGPIISFGVAGTLSELLGDVSYRIPPLTDSDAADLVRDVRAAPIFFGYRGSEGVDVAGIERLILRVAILKDELPEVEHLDLGLVMAGAEGVEVLRVTGRVAPVREARSDWFTRRLTGPAGVEDTLIT